MLLRTRSTSSRSRAGAEGADSRPERKLSFYQFLRLVQNSSHFSFFLDNKVELTYRLSRGGRYRVHLSSAWYRFGQRLLCKEAALLEQPSATSTSSKQVNGFPRRSASDEVDYYITYHYFLHRDRDFSINIPTQVTHAACQVPMDSIQTGHTSCWKSGSTFYTNTYLLGQLKNGNIYSLHLPANLCMRRLLNR